jgi:D-serine deaminase-like pyridoxal phosphate-dependent protein
MTRQSNARPVNGDLVGVPGGALRLTTPALWIDYPLLKSNLAAMMARCREAGLKLRPHGKTHKCTRLARAQLDAGASGICCATPHEAFAFLQEGIRGVLITVPVVQQRHYQMLAALHREGADFSVVIDDPRSVSSWRAALGGASRTLPALVDVDIGMGRTGAGTIEATVGIARELRDARELDYAGVQAYSGRVQHIHDFEERRRIYGEQLEKLRRTINVLKSAGLAPGIVSGGGTGTFAIDADSGVYTESQAGSYLFMDVEYGLVKMFRGERNPWATSLFLRTSVVSANVPGQVTLNAGFKCLATDGPRPEVCGEQFPGSRYEFFGDEYGRLVSGERTPALGSSVDLITPHCDPTVNLHDWYHVIEGDSLVDIWPIDARGVL